MNNDNVEYHKDGNRSVYFYGCGWIRLSPETDNKQPNNQKQKEIVKTERTALSIRTIEV